MSAFKLAICTIFDPVLYGTDEHSSQGIETHYLNIYTIELDEFYNNDYKNIIQLITMSLLSDTEKSHPIIRNYDAIIKTDNYIKLNIIKCDELSGLEQVGYIKTFWLKIIQRRWKNVYKERQHLLTARSNPHVLQERQQTGQWPKHLRNWPKFTLNLYCHKRV
jgi:uncharacterized linocin/CFP29 family protein